MNDSKPTPRAEPFLSSSKGFITDDRRASVRRVMQARIDKIEAFRSLGPVLSFHYEMILLILFCLSFMLRKIEKLKSH